MELYSKEELLKELKKEYSCGGECDHCPEVLDAGSCSVLRCIRRIIDNAEVVSDRYDEGFRDGYAQCINDKEEREENNRLFQKGGAV